MNLLIVDDHVSNLKLLRAQLEREGHTVLEAANGVDALEVLEREKSVDGVISDIFMPAMDGFRLCLEIRKSRKFAALPFIAYSSTYDSPEDRQLAKIVGVDHYLIKPAPVAEILGALVEAAQRTRPRIAKLAAQQDESYVLKHYNTSLVRKLEERNIEVEKALKNLQAAHDKTQESEERFRQLAENIHEVFYLTNATSTEMLYVSPACELVWGRSRESLYAKAHSRFDAIHPDDQPRVREDFKKGLAAGQFDFEYRIVQPSGSVRWIHDRGSAVRGADGNLHRIAGIAENITERKAAEEVLKKRAADLEQFHRLSVGRELQMIELKKQVNALAKQAGQKPPYDLAFVGPEAVKT